MANTAKRPPNSPARLERRQHPRGKIDEVCYVEFPDGGNGGLVLNISETGLLMQSALKTNDQDIARLRFRLPGSEQWIEARAKLTWVGHSGKEAGAQFLDLSEECRARIAEWVATVGPPLFSGAVSTERSDRQETAQNSPATDFIPTADRAHGSQRRNREWLMRSFEQSAPESKPFWRRLGRDLFWAAVGVTAVLVALRYSPKLSMLTRPIPVQESEAGHANAARTPPVKVLRRGDGEHPQAQSSGPAPNSSEAGAVSAAPTGGQLTSIPLAPGRKGSTFGKVLTQTLSPVPAAVQPSATGLDSQATAQSHAHSGVGSKSVSSSASVRRNPSEPSQKPILVGAPAAGAPPTRLILEKEPVSASYFVAITETRSILVQGSDIPTETLQLGELVSHVSPVYPSGVLAKGIDGTVRVRAFIGMSGEVLRVQLLSGPATLASVAMSAIRQWRYGPTLLNGRAIGSQADVSVYFRLH